MNATEVVNGAIIGMDFKIVVVNGKAYTVSPPTIHKISGAGYYLAKIGEGNTLKDLLWSLKDIGGASHALSWLIKGDDSLFEEFSQSPMDDVVNGIETAISLISAENFCKLSVLAKNVKMLTAKQR